MKKKILSSFQSFSKGIFTPVLILPIVGILFAFASIFTNSNILKLIPILDNSFFINFGKILGQSLIPIIGKYLGILFAVGIAIGMAEKEKHSSGMVAMLAYFVFIHSMNVYMSINGVLASPDVMKVSGQTLVMGVQVIDMGIFSGILIGIIAANIHNRFIDVELKGALKIYGGPRLVFVIESLTMILFAIIATHLWPSVQKAIDGLALFIRHSGVFGVFLYGFSERILIPTGLHHLIYTAFLYTGFGGSESVEVLKNGHLVSEVFEGARNIYNAQLGNIDYIKEFTKSTVWDARGISKIFGLSGAALAMYKTALPENKSKVKTILISAVGASVLAGVTEPIEFSFLFTAPILFVVHAVLSGLGMVFFYLLDIRSIIPNGVIDFLLINIPAGIAKTGWPKVVLLGIAEFGVYFIVFKVLIEKFNFKTPGRQKEETKLYSKKDYQSKDNLGKEVVTFLGGPSNIKKVDNCYTRLRVLLEDTKKIDEDGLLGTGASNVIVVDENNVQVIYGLKIRGVRKEVDTFLGN